MVNGGGFLFVDNSTLDEGSQRRHIRSHVMQGKNLGKKRECRRKATALTSTNHRRNPLPFALDPPRALGLGRRPDGHLLSTKRSEDSAQSAQVAQPTGFAESALRQTYVGQADSTGLSKSGNGIDSGVPLVAGVSNSQRPALCDDLEAARAQGQNPATAIAKTKAVVPIRPSTNTTALRPFPGDQFSPFAFPFEMTPHMRRLLHLFFTSVHDSVYPSEFCHTLPTIKTIWFEYLQIDSAYLHCVLGLGASGIEAIRGVEDEPPESIAHLLQSVRLVNQTLSVVAVPQDPTISVVVILLIHEYLRGNVRNTLIHLDGLQRMVELRGGLTALVTNMELLQKICKMDLLFALHYGTEPRFHGGEMSRAIATSLPLKLLAADQLTFASRLPALFQQHIRSAALQELAADMITISRILNNVVDIRSSKLNPHCFQDMLLCVGYGLLELGPYRYHEREGHSRVEELCHLTFVAYMIRLLQQMLRDMRPHPILSMRLKELIARLTDFSNEGCLNNEASSGPLAALAEPSLLLWILLISSISVFGPDDRSWATSQAAQHVRVLSIESWQDCLDMINKEGFPWIPAIHDTRGRELWEEVTRLSEPIDSVDGQAWKAPTDCAR